MKFRFSLTSYRHSRTSQIPSQIRSVDFVKFIEADNVSRALDIVKTKFPTLEISMFWPVCPQPTK